MHHLPSHCPPLPLLLQGKGSSRAVPVRLQLCQEQAGPSSLPLHPQLLPTNLGAGTMRGNQPGRATRAVGREGGGGRDGGAESWRIINRWSVKLLGCLQHYTEFSWWKQFNPVSFQVSPHFLKSNASQAYKPYHWCCLPKGAKTYMQLLTGIGGLLQNTPKCYSK